MSHTRDTRAASGCVSCTYRALANETRTGPRSARPGSGEHRRSFRSAHALRALCLRRRDVGAGVEDLAPLGDDRLVSHADGSDAPTQVVQSDGVQVVALDAQRVLPVDLV